MSEGKFKHAIDKFKQKCYFNFRTDQSLIIGLSKKFGVKEFGKVVLRDKTLQFFCEAFRAES